MSIAIVSTQLTGFNYPYLALIIPFDINHLFADTKVVTDIATQYVFDQSAEL